MIGENVYKYLDLTEEYLDIKTYQENYQIVEDRYILKSPKYSMRLFNWNKYLSQFPFLPKEGLVLLPLLISLKLSASY